MFVALYLIRRLRTELVSVRSVMARATRLISSRIAIDRLNGYSRDLCIN